MYLNTKMINSNLSKSHDDRFLNVIEFFETDHRKVQNLLLSKIYTYLGS